MAKKMSKIEAQNINLEAGKYYNDVESLVTTTNDQNLLNLMFTEITILRMKLDKKDKLYQNFKDKMERKKNIELRSLVKVQFKDVITEFGIYDKVELELINEVLNKIFKNEEKPKNGWQKLWGQIKTAIDKM